ncbi:1-aminocyclopropane-1-carboxylate deaminase/D-cysteine desulfhydrase [Winogradskyella flava]|uniref:1-aminocyclopropane-1-carboxylate deaminase/D-cysteine desulfhydrase n=1 Tax=Winogradskyella flava TaxID=1884876 RepID=A0A842IWV5_9FLAO|nr:pyridoxal-phosphate dependent enzyme [Winogradskyella flava]MBC2846474.1 1-aminocyclopropane-1-carboxylate deaminase/D-cysteine desulfhydrase [Winogradskyella flava]
MLENSCLFLLNPNFKLKTINQEVFFKDSATSLFIKREDLLHPFISGNKYRKLKYNIKRAKETDARLLLTFGGAFSNHIASVAYAGREHGFNTVGVVRGDELSLKQSLNPTLKFACDCGMELKFISRKDYRRKGDKHYIEILKAEYGEFFLIPEGGTNSMAVKGCEEILESIDLHFDYICCAVGTGGTISGLINASRPHQKILGFPALKGDFLREDIRKFAKRDNWELITDYHFGGYAKIKPELITFINRFKTDYHIPLDPIYTGKMMYGILDLIDHGFFPEHAKILAIHTGGLQGIEGMNIKLEKKGWSLIE